MIKRKLKMYAVPTIYVLVIFVFGTSMYLIQRIVNNQTFNGKEVKMEYVDREILIDDEYIPVINTTETISRPYLTEGITINKSFYNYEDEATEQEKALIFYEGTYIQNSGVDYKYNEAFEVVSILDGTVIEITDNSILGKTIKIRHNNDLISTYQSLSEIIVNKDEQVLRGQVIGKSGNCNIYNKDSNLHFELSYQGKNIDPEKAYDKTKDEL